MGSLDANLERCFELTFTLKDVWNLDTNLEDHILN